MIEIDDSNDRWLRAYVTRNPEAAIRRVIDAAQHHRGWLPTSAEVKDARVNVGLPPVLTNAQKTAAMTITPNRARAVRKDRAARRKGKGPAWRLRLIRERAIAIYGRCEARP